jgi:hypothetical protein
MVIVLEDAMCLRSVLQCVVDEQLEVLQQAFAAEEQPTCSTVPEQRPRWTDSTRCGTRG